MFAPKVTKPQARTTEGRANRLVRSISTRDPLELAIFLQPAIGQEGVEENTPIESAPRGVAPDFSKIALFPERRGRPLSQGRAATGLIQPKLAIGSVDDPLEREADATSERVMREPGGQCTSCAAEREEWDKDVSVHRASETSTSGAITLGAGAAARVERTTRRGEPLPAPVRAEMEGRFGVDFSAVRIHRDSEAAESAHAIGARAYTLGNHIAFASGQWMPGTNQGDRLIAHELVHTLQNGGAVIARSSRPSLIGRQSEGGPVHLLLRQAFPGNGMVPPGDCSWARYLVLRGSVETAKAVVNMLGACRAGDSCLFLATKIAAVTAEIAARIAVAAACFRGGDAGHREQVQVKVNMLNRCYEFFLRSNCSPELIAAMALVVEQARAVIAATAAVVALAVIAALIVALVAAIIALVELIAAAAAAAAAAAEGALVAAAAAAILALLVQIQGLLDSGESPEASNTSEGPGTSAASDTPEASNTSEAQV